LGWPSVEKIRKVGSKSFCQQLEVNLPLKIKHEGSRPKCAGIPQRLTATADVTIANKS